MTTAPGSSPTAGEPGSTDPATSEPAVAGSASSAARSEPAPSEDQVVVRVRTDRPRNTISPLIRGFSGGVDVAYLRDVGGTVNSWGGNPSTRYNYQLGNAWNAGADYEFRNGNYGQSGDVAVDFIQESTEGGALVRLAVPTLGWVARNDDLETCSFPTPDGGCDSVAGHNCQNPGPIADPRETSVESTPEMVQAWVERLVAQEGLPVEFIAMDNEPELWGHTHYDVHPSCPTYEEVLDKYLTYANAVRAAAPDAKLLGPVACCWYEYWGIAPGTADGQDVDYLSWFLEQVRIHDEAQGARSLHMLDVHYYPQGDVYNDVADPETSARRLRSTRSLWDPDHFDESWITTPIAFIPRMRETIDAFYPGTGLAITEWNFGADTTMNGGLAIADVLAIYGREGVDMAAYWRHPPAGSPGYFAFKLHGNYDGEGSGFTGDALVVDNSDIERLGAYAAVDVDAGQLRVLLINKDPERTIDVPLSLEGADVSPEGALFRYSADEPVAIVSEAVRVEGDGSTVTVPPYSLTLLELPLRS